MNGKKSRALVIIDPQNDFCDQSGSLYVDGAEGDIFRLARHIAQTGRAYDEIIVSLDSHDVIAIFHPRFWVDASGKNPSPLTQITVSDYRSGKWRASSDGYARYADKMFKTLGEKNMDSMMVWPEHCVVSTRGHQIAGALREVLILWRREVGRAVRYVFKGENPYTEQFSIFEGIDGSWPETAFNENLYSRLKEFDALVFAGEALSHCVEASVSSYVGHGVRRLDQEISILSDCTSPVAGFPRNDSISRLEALGVRFVPSVG
ncbi:MAG: isochorismatase family protein [Synergistaceae bacterium]|jgi:nicotinamidase-related amidase|nr:isochorismatase family protein [Synergistaceae bacterium]